MESTISCKTDRGNFRVQIISDDKPMTVIESKDKKNYICAESGQSFIVRMRQRRDPPKDFYGVKLYIDGKEVNKIKTFKHPSHIFGFKLGNGNYKKFLFDIPPPKDDLKSNDDLYVDNREFGTIKLVFYNTAKVKSKKNQKKEYKYTPHYQSVREEGKKFYERALSIKEGDFYQVEKKDYMQSINMSNEGYDDFIIDFNSKVDEIVFHYTDFFALQILGIVRLLINIYLVLAQKF